MASAAPKRGRNEPEPPKIIIVKKITGDGHGGHHGGAWKVAYADFVTAMMAFFLLLWILGATTEKQRKGIADYFTPTVITTKTESGGATGLLGGDSIISKQKYDHKAAQTGSHALTIPKDATGGANVGAATIHNRDHARFEQLKQQIEKDIAMSDKLKQLSSHVRFTETAEGLRIDLVDGADFSMFALGSDVLVPRAADLIGEVAQAITTVPNGVIVRGHTDSLPYAAGRTVNNWTLSAGRAEATRTRLALGGIGPDRFERIEGVADREPFEQADPRDPRNRRMSITLAWSQGGASDAEAQALASKIDGGTAAAANADAPPQAMHGFSGH